MGIAENSIKNKNNKIKNVNINITYEKIKEINECIYKDLLIDVDKITIKLDQLIEPQMRPRIGFHNIYDPLEKYKKILKKKIKEELLKENINIELSEDFYYVSNIILNKEPPKNFSKKRKFFSLLKYFKFNKKPDLDNCVKTVYDTLEGIIFKNDSQIIRETTSKYYATKDSTEITFFIYHQPDTSGRINLKKEFEKNKYNEDIINYLNKE